MKCMPARIPGGGGVREGGCACAKKEPKRGRLFSKEKCCSATIELF